MEIENHEDIIFLNLHRKLSYCNISLSTLESIEADTQSVLELIFMHDIEMENIRYDTRLSKGDHVVLEFDLCF